MPIATNQTFICYARADEDFVVEMANGLKTSGIPIWLDLWSIRLGEQWMKAIVSAIKNCHQLLIVLSPKSVESEEVLWELNLAMEQNKKIIPVICQKCSIPNQLEILPIVDFTSQDYLTAIQDLCQALGTPPSSI